MSVHPTIAAVTDRIIERSKPTRRRYLDLMADQKDRGINRPRLSCGNFAHGFAASGEDKAAISTLARAEHRHRHGLQRHAVGASALRPLP